MAPSLRANTKGRTEASAKAAAEAKARYKKRPRNEFYPSNKGLVKFYMTQKLNAITRANAANSPLLRLPAEIRNMIFKFAVKLESRESGHNWVGCYFDAEGKISRWQRHSFVHCEDKLLMALSLPGVCRQIYTETATLLFSQNTFAFDSEFSMDSWLNRRLIAQRESIKYLILPKYVRVDYHTWEDVDITEELTARVRETCPNLVELIGGNECEDLKNMVYGPNSADPLNWSFAFLRGSG